ncbi:MAG: prenyltransferase [Candidatus Thorarchaeota archaeon]
MNQGSFKVKLISWVSAGRFVFFPWVLLNSLFGAVLGSFHLLDWFFSFLVAFSTLTMGHFMNDWRDFVNGLDKMDEGSEKKPYTNAQQILPRGLLSLRTVKISALFFGLLGLIILIGYFDFSIDAYAFYLIGVLMALTYTDFAKPKGIGEIHMFLGHGLSTVCFTYSIINGLDVIGFLGGCLLGFWSAAAYTVDQWKDIQVDQDNGISTLAHKLSSKGLEPWKWWTFVVLGSMFIQAALIVFNVLSVTTAITVLMIPLAWLVHRKLKQNFDEGLLLVLVCMWVYTSLLIAGIAIDMWVI